MQVFNRHGRCAARAASALLGLALVAASMGCGRPAQEQRQLTILLAEYRGAAPTAEAWRVGKELTDKGLPDVFIIDGAGVASLCTGHYDSLKDNRADEMLKAVRRIRDAAGNYPFAGVMLVPIPEPLPQNPWPLEQAKGPFTLHVASWELPGRMAKAQAYAAELRAQGFEAYVYHGPRLSIVTLGSFGPEIYDNPSAVGRPKTKPNIVSPKILELQKKFPSVRLDGELAPPAAGLTAQPIIIPGHDAPPVTGVPLPKVLYRVSLALVDTKTGVAEGRGLAAGVAQSSSKGEVSRLVAALVKQLADAIPAGRPARIGIAGVLAKDADAARDKADVAALEALTEAVSRLPQDKVVVFGIEATRQYLDAAGVTTAAVLADPRPLKGVQAFDFVITGSVTSFPRQ
jgi:hypothetical protein